MPETISLRSNIPLPEMIYWAVAISMAAAFLLTLAIASFDVRTIDGSQSVWLKPLKFELSLALVLGGLSQGVRTGPVMTIVAVVFIAACTIEMSYIIGQAARAEHSHFNMTTPFTRFMWSVMAIAAIVIICAAAAIGIATAMDSDSAFEPALKWAIALGLIGGTLLTLYTAFTIGARMSPYVGTIPTDEALMALTGWSRVGGDIRVSHFLATHMIQALPIVGIGIAYLMPSRIGVIIVVLAAVVWSSWTLTEYTRALSGKPSPVTQFLS